jgi:hypothetical protein
VFGPLYVFVVVENFDDELLRLKNFAWAVFGRFSLSILFETVTFHFDMSCPIVGWMKFGLSLFLPVFFCAISLVFFLSFFPCSPSFLFIPFLLFVLPSCFQICLCHSSADPLRPVDALIPFWFFLLYVSCFRH